MAMAPDHETLQARDYRRIAELHLASLEGSLPGMLGSAYLEAFYRFLAGSDEEQLLVERVDGAVESVCVLSFDADGLDGRALRGTLVPLIGSASRAALSSGAFRRFCWRTARSAVSGGAAPFGRKPEITHIFTNAALRGHRLGARLVERVDELLGQRGVGRYYVRTVDSPTNRALKFYERMGFRRIDTHHTPDNAFAVFEKVLAAPV